MKVTVREISQQLSARAESFARWLLPNGRLNGGNWECGGITGEAGHSLRVQVTGPNSGVWADFATDDRGDLIELCRLVRNVSIGDAIRVCKDWLGIRDPVNVVPAKSYNRPDARILKPLTEVSPVVAYLQDTRCLSFLTWEMFGVTESELKGCGPAIAFPYVNPQGELVNIKRLALQRSESGKKIIIQEKGCAPSLFGWQAIPPGARDVVITEGEIDAMTWHQMGYDALSIPDGAAGSNWVDLEWENLERFATIYLNWDNDTEGQKNVEAFAARLGLSRCPIVRLEGHKDANEALQAGEGESYFQDAIARARPLTPKQIRDPIEFLDKVIDKFYQPEEQKGFQSALFGNIRFRSSEVTCWTGISGHGKSVLLSQLMLEAALGGYKVAIASMEMKGEATLYRMLMQSERISPVPRDDIRPILEWMGGKIWIYDILGNVSPKLLLELMEYSYSRSGVNMFVIDSLMKCAIASDDYEAQRIFMNDVCAFAQSTGVHVHVVAHARKGADEFKAPGKLDVKGSSDLINQPDNMMSVFRCKDSDGNDEGVQTPDSPGAIVRCTKQRETGEEFSARLRHNRGIYRYSRIEWDDRQDLSITLRIAQELPVEQGLIPQQPDSPPA